MKTPAICRNWNEFYDEIIRFQGKLGVRGLKAKGEKTMGGIHDAPGALKGTCKDNFGEDLSSATALEVAEAGYRVLNSIVSDHVFHDGNGRTSMYAM
jgi:Fic/DOC family